MKENKNRNKKHCTAILLSAGTGKRMNSKVAKQYLNLLGKPVIWYSLQTIQQSEVIDECILVTGADDVEYVRKDIVERYHFSKVSHIVAGGAERYDSVYNALVTMYKHGESMEGYVFIHDGARPFLSEEIIASCYECVEQYKACVVGMPVKDTIKIADEEGFAAQTPDRKRVWQVQTPQVFDKQLAYEAYIRLYECREELRKKKINITDDAMVVETVLGHPVKLVEGSYRNIKITTPEDLDVAAAFLGERKGN